MHVHTYTFDQLAVLFQRSAATLRGHIDTLEREHNFPARLPCLDNLWSKPAVDRWFENNGHQPVAPLIATNTAPGDASLAMKYGDA